MYIRFRVELSEAERDVLTAMLSGGRQAARKLKRAQIHLVARISGADALGPTRVRGHAVRTYSGRPSSSMRLSTWTAIATSVA